MKLKPWIHSALHIGCVALLLLQGHRIQQIQKLETNYLNQGFTGVGVPSTELGPLACYRWVNPESKVNLPKTYFCFLPEAIHQTASR